MDALGLVLRQALPQGGALVLNQNYQSVFARDGVYVFKRVAGPASTPAGKTVVPYLTPSPAASPTATPAAP